MAAHAVRIQICGSVAVDIDGTRRDDVLPGPQGRRAFAYLVLRRHEPTDRDELVAALWGENEAGDSTIVALVSKIRKVAPVVVRGGQLRLDLPPNSWVDLEAARESIHRAESAATQALWVRSWGAAQTALFTARRGFLPGEPSAWAEDVRAELNVLRERALEVYADAALHIAGTELATAERASRELCALAPFRESGYRLLMRALAAKGNDAEAMRVYEQLRGRLRDELGVDPSEATRALHLDLLNGRQPPPAGPSDRGRR
jgi:DNA-binding SARP family transcriptional activator